MDSAENAMGQGGSLGVIFGTRPVDWGGRLLGDGFGGEGGVKGREGRDSSTAARKNTGPSLRMTAEWKSAIQLGRMAEWTNTIQLGRMGQSIPFCRVPFSLAEWPNGRAPFSLAEWEKASHSAVGGWGGG